MSDKYDEVAERIRATGMPMGNYQAGTDKIAAILCEAFLSSIQVFECPANLMEQLAAIEHDRWSGQARTALDEMTPERRERWDRLSRIPYADLDEFNKGLDRMQVREYWPVIARALRSRPAEPAAPCESCQRGHDCGICGPPAWEGYLAPEPAQAASSEELIAYYERVVKEEYPEEDKPSGWPSWRAKAEEMERNWLGATETHRQEKARGDELSRQLAEERAKHEGEDEWAITKFGEPLAERPAPDVTVLREPLRWFAGEMERKLKANDYKGGWSDCHPAYLMERLLDEAEELRDCPDDDLQGHIDEAADIANYAMMLADQARALLCALSLERKGD